MKSEKDIRSEIEKHQSDLTKVLLQKEQAALIGDVMKIHECNEKEFYHRTCIALFSWVAETKTAVPTRVIPLTQYSYTSH